MKISDILLKPKFLRSEIEALQLLACDIERKLPESPILSQIRATIAEYEKEVSTMEAWLNSVSDDFIRQTIITFQQCGDWSKTNSKMYGYQSYHCCRKAVVRYLKKTDFTERFG